MMFGESSEFAHVMHASSNRLQVRQVHHATLSLVVSHKNSQDNVSLLYAQYESLVTGLQRYYLPQGAKSKHHAAAPRS
jgi:hypothetical protein